MRVCEEVKGLRGLRSLRGCSSRSSRRRTDASVSSRVPSIVPPLASMPRKRSRSRPEPNMPGDRVRGRWWVRVVGEG